MITASFNRRQSVVLSTPHRFASFTDAAGCSVCDLTVVLKRKNFLKEGRSGTDAGLQAGSKCRHGRGIQFHHLCVPAGRFRKVSLPSTAPLGVPAVRARARGSSCRCWEPLGFLAWAKAKGLLSWRSCTFGWASLRSWKCKCPLKHSIKQHTLLLKKKSAEKSKL